MKTEKKRTKTASFGVNGRRSHDSSAYYARRINEDLSRNRKRPAAYSENPLPEHLVNRVLLDSCVAPDKSKRLPPRSVHLMVTSPPYAVGKDYDEDLSLSEYRKLLRDAWKETRFRSLGPRPAAAMYQCRKHPLITAVDRPRKGPYKRAGGAWPRLTAGLTARGRPCKESMQWIMSDRFTMPSTGQSARERRKLVSIRSSASEDQQE